MLRIWIISRRTFEITLPPEVKYFPEIEDDHRFYELLAEAIEWKPDLLVLHPPSEDVAIDALNYLKSNSYDSLRSIFMTTKKIELDHWFEVESGFRVVRVYESLLEMIWPNFLKRLEADSSRNLHLTLIDSTIESLIVQKDRTTIDDLDDKAETIHSTRNINGALSMTQIAEGKHLLKQPAVGELKKALEILIRKSPKREDLGFEHVPLINVTDFSQGISPPLQRALFIDDEHERGWSTVFGALIFGRTDLVYKITPLTKSSSEKQMFSVSHWRDGGEKQEAIISSAYELELKFPRGLFAISDIGNNGENIDRFLKRKVINEYQKELIPFDVILLDFRLKAEGREIPPTEVSGYKLAGTIHRNDPSVPIIVVSASDKVWTLLSMRNEGAWDYYLKPGSSPSGGIGHDEYANQDLLKLITRLNQASQYPWARAVYSMNEWLHEITDNLKHSSLDYDLFKRNFDWIAIRRSISRTLELVSEHLTESSRLGMIENNGYGLGSKPMKHSLYLLAMCWEDIKDPLKYTKRNSDIIMCACDKIAHAYRNIIVHGFLPLEISNHIHLLVQAFSLVSLLPRSLRPILPEQREWDIGETETNLGERADAFIEWVDINSSNKDFFNYKPNTDLPNPLCFLKGAENRLENLKRISNRLEKNFFKTTWIDILTHMLIVLLDPEFNDQYEKQEEASYISFHCYIQGLFTYASGILLKNAIT